MDIRLNFIKFLRKKQLFKPYDPNCLFLRVRNILYENAFSIIYQFNHIHLCISHEYM